MRNLLITAAMIAAPSLLIAQTIGNGNTFDENRDQIGISRDGLFEGYAAPQSILDWVGEDIPDNITFVADGFGGQNMIVYGDIVGNIPADVTVASVELNGTDLVTTLTNGVVIVTDVSGLDDTAAVAAVATDLATHIASDLDTDPTNELYDDAPITAAVNQNATDIANHVAADLDTDPTNELYDDAPLTAAVNANTASINAHVAADLDTDPFNEIELPATAAAGEVVTWDGSSWVSAAPPQGDDATMLGSLQIGASQASHQLVYSGRFDDGTAIPRTFVDIPRELPTTATPGHVATWDGTNWIGQAPATGGGDDATMLGDVTTFAFIPELGEVELGLVFDDGSTSSKNKAQIFPSEYPDGTPVADGDIVSWNATGGTLGTGAWELSAPSGGGGGDDATMLGNITLMQYNAASKSLDFGITFDDGGTATASASFSVITDIVDANTAAIAANTSGQAAQDTAIAANTTDIANHVAADLDTDPNNEIELPTTGTVGHVATFDGTNWIGQAPSGGLPTTQPDATPLENGDVAVYNTTTSAWEAVAPSGGGDFGSMGSWTWEQDPSGEYTLHGIFNGPISWPEREVFAVPLPFAISNPDQVHVFMMDETRSDLFPGDTAPVGPGVTVYTSWPKNNTATTVNVSHDSETGAGSPLATQILIKGAIKQ